MNKTTSGSSRLGGLLQACGLVDEYTLNQSIETAARSGLPLGTALLGAKVVLPEDLETLLRLQKIMRMTGLPLVDAVEAFRRFKSDGLAIEEALAQVGAASVSTSYSKLGTLLVDAGIISKKQLEETQRSSYEKGMPLGRILTLRGLITPGQLTRVLELQRLLRDRVLTREKAIAEVKKFVQPTVSTRMSQRIENFSSPPPMSDTSNDQPSETNLSGRSAATSDSERTGQDGASASRGAQSAGQAGSTSTNASNQASAPDKQAGSAAQDTASAGTQQAPQPSAEQSSPSTGDSAYASDSVQAILQPGGSAQVATSLQDFLNSGPPGRARETGATQDDFTDTADNAHAHASSIQSNSHLPTLGGRHVKLGELLLLSGIVTELDVMNTLEVSLNQNKSIGDVLTETGMVPRHLLDAAIEMQKAVNVGEQSIISAAQTLSHIAKTGEKPKLAEQAGFDELCNTIKLGELLKLCQLANDEEIEYAINLVSLFPSLIGKLLLVAGVIDEPALLAALRCQYLIREKVATVEEAAAALKHAVLHHLSIDDALEEVRHLGGGPISN